MKFEPILLGIIFIPTLGAFILPLIGKVSARFRNWLALCFVASSFLLSLLILPHILSGKTILINRQFAYGFNFVFNADMLAVFMACVSSLVSTIIVFYSFGYISHYENQDEYYLMVVLFLGAMMGLVFASNLILLYVFWEITVLLQVGRDITRPYGHMVSSDIINKILIYILLPVI